MVKKIALFSLLRCSLIVHGASLETGVNAWQQGDTDTAIGIWKVALANTNTSVEHAEIALALGTAYQAAGNYPAAISTLNVAVQSADAQSLTQLSILTRSHLGDALLAIQQPADAETQLGAALSLAREHESEAPLAHVLNNLGNLAVFRKDYQAALQFFQEAYQLSEKHRLIEIGRRITVNYARLYLKLNQYQDATAQLIKKSALPKHAKDYDEARYIMQLGELWLSIYKQSDGAEALRKAHQAFSITLAFARQTGQKALIAQASGALGHLYEFSTDYPTAETLTRQAIFASQSTPVQHYRWEWQLARLLRKQQQLDEANSTYRRVLELLQNIRSGLNSGRQSAAVTFSSEVRPVYFGLVEVLLQQASGRSGPDKASLLKEARGVAEQLKAAELEDYFRDECVANARAKNRTLDDISANTAIIYPLVLEERLELLVSVAGQIHQITIPISAQELARIVEELQINLQIRTHWQFYYSAELLYRRMIQPILPILQSFQVDTLVIVPDGPLRMIPLGALYNATSKRFLIEDYALVITPGLELTDPRPLQRNEIMLLLNGLSEEVQQFPPLPSVKNEIASIRDLFGQPQVLMNNEFTYASLSRSLTEMPFSIVHIASHGQFDQDPENTFLLTYEDKLTMNRLERLLKSGQARDKPVELLTLSACQTAVGDERAALGLAGVAIKAGARSALASLWFVNDDSTAELISEFYRQLYQSDISKAQALRNAQVKLITEKTYYRHPFYWSPFLLIGNWL